MKYLLIILVIAVAFMFGDLYGYVKSYKHTIQRRSRCLQKYSWVTDGEVCKALGARTYKNGTCAPSMKIARLYASDNVLNCITGVKR